MIEAPARIPETDHSRAAPDWVQLMLFLDEIGLDARIVLIGIRRIISDQGVVFAVLDDE